MSTINANMSDRQPWVPCDPASVGSGFYTIDNENLYLRPEQHRTTDTDPRAVSSADGRWAERGIAGSDAATHTSGATLTPYYPAAPATNTGGEQRVRLLGPFAVAFDTPGITDQAALTTLSAGVAVIRAWARVTASWSPSNPGFRIGAGGSGAVTNGDYWTVTEYDALGEAQEDSGAFAEANIPVDQRIVTVLENGFLVAHLTSAAAQGEADIYALIAEPAE